jgi:hypothetical protein
MYARPPELLEQLGLERRPDGDLGWMDERDARCVGCRGGRSTEFEEADGPRRHGCEEARAGR